MQDRLQFPIRRVGAWQASSLFLSRSAVNGLNLDLPHRLLITLLKLPVEGNVLINSQSLTLGMAGDQLQFRIRHAGMPGQPGNRRMPELCGVAFTPAASA